MPVTIGLKEPWADCVFATISSLAASVVGIVA